MSKKGRGGYTPVAMRLAVCDVTGCSNLVDAATLLRFPPMSRVQDRVRWWHALYGRVNFRLSTNSAVLASVCPRHFSAPNNAFPIPDQALPDRREPLVPIPTELVREKGAASVRTYSRRPLASGTSSPVRYKAIAPATPAPTLPVSRWTMPVPAPAPASTVINRLVAPAPAQQQYQILPAGGATVAPAPTFQVVPAGGSGGGVIQLMSSGGGQVTAPAHGSQFQLVTSSSAGPTASQGVPAGLRVIQPASASRVQLVPTCGAQLLLMPSQQTASPVSTLQPNLPLVVVNSNGQPAPPAAPPPPPPLQRLPLPRLPRPPAAAGGERTRRGRRAAAARQSAATSLAISEVQSVRKPAVEHDDDVEVIDVAFGLPEGKGDPRTKVEVIELPDEDSDAEVEDSPVSMDDVAPATPDTSVDVLAVPAEMAAESQDAAEGAEGGAAVDGTAASAAAVGSQAAAAVVKQESETAAATAGTGHSQPAAAVVKQEPPPAETASSSDTDQPRAAVKQEPAEANGAAPTPAASAAATASAAAATTSTPSMIRLKPISELTSTAGQRAAPPRVPTPPGISLGSGAGRPLSEADLMLRSMKARQRQEEALARLEPPPAAKRPRPEDAAKPSPPPPAPPPGLPPSVQVLPGNTYVVDSTAAPPSPPAPPASVSVDRLSAPPAARPRRSALEVVRGCVAASHRQWRKRGCHVRYRRQDRELGAVLDVLLSETLRSSWNSIAESLNASTNRDTLVGLINHFILIEKLGLAQPEQGTPEPPSPSAPSSERCQVAPEQNGHASPDPVPEPEPAPAAAEQSAPEVQSFSLPAGLSITPLTEPAKSSTGESAAGSSNVTITPVARQRPRPRDDGPAARAGDGPAARAGDGPAARAGDGSATRAGAGPATVGLTWHDRKRCVRLVACFLCGAGGFTSWLAVHQHLQHYHKERSVLFPDTAAFNPGSFVVCALCPEVTPSSGASVRHASNSHSQEVGNLTIGSAKLRCDVCMLVVGHSCDSAMQHNVRCSRMDGQTPSYTCVPCSADLRLLVDVSHHVEEHSGGRLGYQSRCQLCAFSGDFASCRRHVRTVHNDHCFLLGCALCPRFGTDNWTHAEQHVYRNHKSTAEPVLHRCQTCELPLAGGTARVNQHGRLHRNNKAVTTAPSRPARPPVPPGPGTRPASPPHRRPPGRVPGAGHRAKHRRPGPRSRTGPWPPPPPPPASTGDTTASDDDPSPQGAKVVTDVIEVDAVEMDVKPTELWAEQWRSDAGWSAAGSPSADPKLAMDVRVHLRRLELTDFL